MRTYFIGILSLLLLMACQNRQTNAGSTILTDSIVQQPDTVHKDVQVTVLAKQVLTVLKGKDYESFAHFIHPVIGVRFSPYGHIDTAADKVFSTGAFLDELSKNPQTTITWGQYDGTGEPIVLTIEAYFNKFVYNADFLNAPQTGFNKIIGKGLSVMVSPDNCFFAGSLSPVVTST